MGMKSDVHVYAESKFAYRKLITSLLACTSWIFLTVWSFKLTCVPHSIFPHHSLWKKYVQYYQKTAQYEGEFCRQHRTDTEATARTQWWVWETTPSWLSASAGLLPHCPPHTNLNSWLVSNLSKKKRRKEEGEKLHTFLSFPASCSEMYLVHSGGCFGNS